MPDEINFQGFFILHCVTIGIFFATKALNPKNTRRKFHCLRSLFRVFVVNLSIAYFK